MTVPVVLIPGAWCSAASWQRVASILTPRGYDCVMPVLPAHEATADQPLRVRGLGLGDYLGALEADLAARMFSMPPILIGHSLGALLAQQLAIKVQPLALVMLSPLAPAGIGSPAVRAAALLPWLAAGLRGSAYKPSFGHACRTLFNTVGADRQRALHETLIHESARSAVQLGFSAFTRWAVPKPGAVRCPVYIVSAGRDRFAPAAAAHAVARAAPGAALRHYPERGHWLIDDEETEEMMHGICGWLRPLEQRAVKPLRGR